MEDLPIDPPEADPRLRDSGLMRRVNLNMRQLADTFGHADPIIFFCECQTSSCYAPISLDMTAFDAAMAARMGWLLVEGHAPSASWPPTSPADSPETAGLPRARPAASRHAFRPAGWSASLRGRLARSA